MKIALVIGHNGKRQGAYGSKGISEWQFNSVLIEEILNQVNTKACIKVFKRSAALSGYTKEMIALHKELDEWGSDITISFHFNAALNENVNGNEVLYMSTGGKRVAEIFNVKFSEYLPNNKRGVKRLYTGDRGYGFVGRGQSKCVILEPFFASHQHQYVEGGIYRDRLVDAIVEAIEELV